MIKGTLTTFPWGMLTGLPVLALDIEGELSDDGSAGLALAVGRALGRNAGASRVLVRRAPWADERLAGYIGALADLELDVLGMQTATATAWGYVEIPWYVDASSVVADATSAAAVASRMQALVGFPRPAELLIRPLPGNLSPEILDALKTESAAVSGEIQVDAAHVGAALHAVAKAAPFWRVVVAQPPAPEFELFRVAG